MKIKRWFYLFLHLNFITGFLYAFYHFINTPRSIFLHRRLWAYESWIILSFYGLFIFLILFEQEKLKTVQEQVRRFQAIILVNLLLLILPWGAFLLLAPTHLLEIFSLNSIYWRLLGAVSLVSAAVYYFPYRFKGKKMSRWLLGLGAVGNFVTAVTLSLLFTFHQVPLVVFSATPLLFYFSYFFFDEWSPKKPKLRRKNSKKSKKSWKI